MVVAVLLLFVHVLVSGYVSGETDSEVTFDHVLYTEEYEIEGDLEDSLLVKRLASVPIENLQVPLEVPFSGTVRASGKVVMLGHFGVNDIFGIPMQPQPPHNVAPPTPNLGTVCPTCGTKCPTSCSNCPNCGTSTSTPSTICPKCGVKCPTCSTNCPSCGTSVKQSTTCPNCGINCLNCGTNCPNCGTRIGNPGVVCSNCGANCAHPGSKCTNCGAQCSSYDTITVPFSGIVPASGKVTIDANFNDNGLDQLFQRQNGNPTNLPKLCPNQGQCDRVPVLEGVTTAASFDNSGKMVQYKSAPSTMIPQMSVSGLPPSTSASSPPQSNCPCMKLISPAPCQTPVPPFRTQDYSSVMSSAQNRMTQPQTFATTVKNPQMSPNQFMQAPHVPNSQLSDLPKVNMASAQNRMAQPLYSTSVKIPQTVQTPRMLNLQLSDLPRLNVPQSVRTIEHQSSPNHFDMSQIDSPQTPAGPYQLEPITLQKSSENTEQLNKQLTPMNIKPTYNLPTNLSSPYNKIPILLGIPPLSFPWGVFQLTTLPGIIPSSSTLAPVTYFTGSSAKP